MNLNPIKISNLPKILSNNLKQESANIRVVEWKSYNKNQNGIALIGTENGKDGKYRELYADGTVYIKNRLGNIQCKDNIDFQLLEEAVNNYKNNKWNIINISGLLEKTKNTKAK